ncbi:unnamed protein product [Candida verbasci]|uniref:WDR59/RTC1-like RING zinc finger domain-containing protein n=1 Tax=Candida verbasci TaxID=1227364 RepID=A0A9W4TRH6_9ASCO|nr:unnamed protein product [Candida verbasci]
MVNPNDSTTFGNSLSLRVDGAIGAMSLSPNGRDCVLAGRKGLFIIDLDDPFTPPRWLHHITSWEVADVQWSPHHFIKPSWVISTSNQKGLLWDLSRPSNNAIANILHSHTRAISDINFHPFDPEILATCSIDTFIMSWDMRTPRKPVAKWAEWRAGAIQAKWNHENPFEIASSHDNSFYVWDTRKGALPVVKVEKAHEGKINGLDFNQGLKNVITCSNDKTVKFWNLKDETAQKHISEFSYFDLDSNKEKLCPSVIIKTDFPIARARTLPFGSDKACGIMPLIGGKDSIYIANYDAAYSEYLASGLTQTINLDSAYTFKGHSGPMKDFLWRTKRKQYEGFELKNKWEDYQLVTWAAQEYDLKLWQHDEEMYKSVNYNPSFLNVFKDESDSESRPSTPAETNQEYNYDTYCHEPSVTIDDLAKTNGGDLLSALTLLQIAEKHKQLGHEFNQLNHLNWISGVKMGHAGRDDRKVSSTSTLEDDGPTNLGEEVSIVGHKFPKIRFEKISVSTGELVISLNGPIPNKDEEETEEESKLVFVRVEITFPKNYPYLDAIDYERNLSTKKLVKISKQNLIKFNIEETHELAKSIRDKLQDGLNEIAQFYCNKYNRFCLEPCLRYLLGDKVELNDESMIDTRAETNEEDDECIQEVGNEAWVDDLLNQQPGFNEILSSAAAENGYSSGDEDAEFGDLLQDDTKSLIKPEVDDKIVDSTPIPKGCGAVWSPSGQLICFFIPKNKDDDRKHEFDTYAFGEKDGSIASDSEVEDSDLDKTDDALMKKMTSTSSDSSLKNDWNQIIKDDASKKKLPGLFHLGLNSRFDHESSHKSSLNRFTSIDGASNNRSTSRSYKKFDNNKKHKNIVGIFDYSHLLPDKLDLAKEYKISNETPENLANYNSKVALKHGLKDISDIWKILEIILMRNNNHSLQFFDDYYLKQLPNEINLSSQNFFWGCHPFSKWLIRELFNYFEQRQNVQMLAMMACILFENPKKFEKVTSVKSPSRKSTFPNLFGQQSILSQSFSSSFPHSQPLHSNFSSPPELNHRNSSFASVRNPHINYAPSISSSIDSNSIHNESPDKFSYFRKAMMGSPSQYPTNNSYSSLSELINEPKSLYKRVSNKFIESRKPKKLAKTKIKEPTVTHEFMNSSELDLFENEFNEPLLNSINQEKLKLYRELYSDMLYNWGLTISRLEVLEFNFMNNNELSNTHDCKIGVRKKIKQQPNQNFINAITTISMKIPNSWNTKKGNALKHCILCDLIVSKSFTLCTVCEHVLHITCANEWWQENIECASGCGCKCLEYSI